MKHQETIQVIKSRFDRIQKAFDRTTIQFNAEEIHNFRIEVKKLRAFLRLAATEKKVKLPKWLHKFYRMAGLIRNLELQQERVREAFRDKAPFPQSYLNMLDEETASNIILARKLSKKLSIKIAKRRVLDAVPARLTKDRQREFVRNTGDRLEIPMETKGWIDDETMHDLRKCLKDLLYDRSYIKKRDARLLPVHIPDKKKLFPLTEVLGKFQDIRFGLHEHAA
jgi:CHAD domain-containing protein